MCASNTEQSVAPTPLKILIVEDNDDDTYLLTRHLSRIWSDMTVYTSDSLEEAFRLNRLSEFDYIFLDLNLPDSYGAATVNMMREMNRNAKIIVVTGLKTDEITQKVLQNGAAAVLSKSAMTARDFIHVIENTL